MRSSFQKGQKVITPKGEATVIDIIGERIIIKLPSGEEETFADGDLEDAADQG